MIKNIFIFLLLCGLAAAWTPGYAPPSCVSQYSIVGVNFSYSPQSAPISCVINTSLIYGSMVFNTPQYTTTSAKILFVSLPNDNLNHTGSMTKAASVGNAIAFSNGSTIINITTNGASTLFLNQALTGIGYNLSIFQDASLLGSIAINTGNTFNITFYPPTAPDASSDSVTLPSYISSSPFEMSYLTIPILGSPYYWYVSSYNNSAVLRSDFATSGLEPIPNISNYYRANLFYGSPPTAIKPKITYFPLQKAFPDFYNTSDGTIYLKNNTPAYIYDTNLGCWFNALPLIVADNTTIQSNSNVVLISCQSGLPNSSAIVPPVLPLFYSCAQSGPAENLQYTIQSLFSLPMNHSVSYSGQNGSGTYAINNASLYYTVNATQYPSINYTVNNYLLCQYANSSTLLGLAQIPLNNSMARAFMGFMFISSLASSAFIPFSAVFSIMVNDYYHFVPNTTMVLLVIMAGIVSALALWNGESTLKRMLIHISVAFSFIILISTQALVNLGSYTAKINARWEAIIAFAMSGLSITSNPLSILAVLPQSPAFILNLLLLLLDAPFFVLNVLTTLISSSLPAWVPTFTLLNGVAVGLTAIILIKAYEVVTNKFRPT